MTSFRWLICIWTKTHYPCENFKQDLSLFLGKSSLNLEQIIMYYLAWPRWWDSAVIKWNLNSVSLKNFSHVYCVIFCEFGTNIMCYYAWSRCWESSVIKQDLNSRSCKPFCFFADLLCIWNKIMYSFAW